MYAFIDDKRIHTRTHTQNITLFTHTSKKHTVRFLYERIVLCIGGGGNAIIRLVAHVAMSLMFTSYSALGIIPLPRARLSLGGGVPQLIWTSAEKRQKLNDFHPVSSVFSVKTIVMNAMKSCFVIAMPELIAFNQYIESGQDPDDFDLDAAIDRALQAFPAAFFRNSTITIIKKAYDVIAVHTLPLNLADKLSKDMFESARRKWVRYPAFVVAVPKIFWTSVRASSILYASIFSFNLFHDLYVWTKSKEKRINVAAMSKWVFKNAIVSVASVIATSAGFAVGSFGNINFLGAVSAALSEALVVTILGAVAPW